MMDMKLEQVVNIAEYIDWEWVSCRLLAPLKLPHYPILACFINALNSSIPEKLR